MIEQGKKVKVHYTGRLDEDNIFDSSVGREPLEFVVGEGTLIPGFENGVIGMSQGEKKTIELSVDEAYGQLREELISDVPKENLPEGVQVGQSLQAMTEQGPINVVVTEINETTAKVDANHPLAGKNLIFDLEIVEVN